MDDVVIVGGGIIGAATAYFLSKEGRKVKVIERIIGDWVVKESSTMYIKDDASTIYFPLEVEPGSSQLITYTYKKEWK